MSTTAEVYIIGGGWAGLSAAVELSRQGIVVTLLESARQLGGRARRIPFNNKSVDNGQHLIVGAYRNTLALMQTLGVDITKVLKRKPLAFNMRYANGDAVSLSVSHLPTPLHLLMGLIKSKGLSLLDRLRATQFGFQLFMQNIPLTQDISVAELLARCKQPTRLIETLWGPLCIATLNTPLHKASAQIFIHVLHTTFMRRREDSDLLFTQNDLGSLLPDPAANFIERHGGNIRLGQRITGLKLENNKTQGIDIEDKFIPANRVILAVSPFASHALMAEHYSLQTITDKLNKFFYEPICTIYLQYPEHVRLDTEIVGLVNTTAQWVFDRRINHQPGLMAVVISASGAHMDLDNKQLVQRVTRELANLYPDWPAPIATYVLREKRATFSCTPGITPLRPKNETPVKGLWLAGDYTDTSYPATLEGAVHSGLQCAKHVLQDLIQG